MEESKKSRRVRRAGLGLAGGAAAVLAVTATAWACTASNHQLRLTSKSGSAGTVTVASGVCSGPAGCPTGTVQLRQDATPSIGVASVDDHQVLCDASDPSIGTVTNSGGSLSGSGTIAARTLPGPYIVCAGDTNASTEILWENFTLS